MLLAFCKLLDAPRSSPPHLGIACRGIRTRRRPSITYVVAAKAQRIWAVKVGRVPGIYESASEAWSQTDGYPGAKWRYFALDLRPAAEAYIDGRTDKGPTSSSSRLVAYTDGGFRDGIGGAGVYWAGEPGVTNIRERLPAIVKDAFAAELYAVLLALEADPCRTRPLSIHTDSAYVREAFSDPFTAPAKVFGPWQEEWTADLMALIADYLIERPAPCEFRRAHSNLGEFGNFKADSLARRAILKNITSASKERDFAQELASRREAPSRAPKHKLPAAEHAMANQSGPVAEKDVELAVSDVNMEKSRAYELKLLKKRRMIQDRIARYREEERQGTLQLAAARSERIKAMQKVQAAREEEEKEKGANKAEWQKDDDQGVAAVKIGEEQRRAERAQPQLSQPREASKDPANKLDEPEARQVERGAQSKTSRAHAVRRPGGQDARPEVTGAHLEQPEKARRGRRRSKAGAAKGTPRLSLVEMLRAQALTASQQPKSLAEQQ